MRYRFRFTSLGISLLVVLALSCTSHRSARTAAPDTHAPSRAAAVVSGSIGGGGAAQPAAHLEVAMRVQATAAQGGPASAQAVAFGESPAVRDLPPAAVATDLTDQDREAAEGPENPEVRHAVPSAKPSADPALQTKASIKAISPPIVSFDGLNNTDNFNAFGGRVNPSDDNGDVGPNHYVQQINLLVRVFDKTGAPLTAPFKLSSLWSAVGGQCSAPDAGDPVVLYDALADRWFLSQFAFTSTSAPPYHECVAVSKTADPTGAYYLFDFVTAGNEFPDYPKPAVWPDAYYMMVHQFTNGGPFNGTGVYALDRKKMLAGDPTASYIYFNLNLTSHPEGIGGGLFADVDGLTPPPAGHPGIFAYFTSTHFGDPADGIRLFEFHADFAVPANSTFTEPQTTYAAPLAVAAFDPTNPSGRRDIPQPPPTTVTAALDGIEDRFLHRMAYRNFGDHESLVLNHTVGAPGSTTFGVFRAGVRYYEVRRPLPAGLFFINDQATFAPADGVNRWMAAAAMDHEGNVGIGYSVSSTSVFPGIRYTGRLASDPPNTLQAETELIAGTGVQTTTNNRWGDYSGMAVDPSDDCTFWFTDEYYTAASQATSAAGWLTRVGTFKVNPECVAPAQGTLNGNVTFCDTGAGATGALVEISDGHTAPVTAAGNYSIKLSPGTYSIHVTGPSCTPTSPVSVTITDGGTATFDTCLSGSPSLTFRSATVSGGNGNGIIDRNECNTLTLTLGNIGCLTDTGIAATLSTSTPGVTIRQPQSPYPNVPEMGSAANSIPFEVSTSSSFLCGTIINFTETVNDLTGAHTFNFSLPSCTTAPVTVTGSIDNSDPTQNLRLFRDGVSSSCASPKAACPGTTGTGTRHYDAYNFTNNGAVTACVKVDVSGPCAAGGGSGTNIFSTAYLGSFNPAGICQNYLADEGASFTGTGTYFFNLPAGQTAVVVVNEVNSGQGCSAYSLQVSGLFADTDGGGECPGLTSSVATSSLWPPNHNLINVGLAATATGDCGPRTLDVQVFSDEDDVDPTTIGDMSPDAKDITVGTLRLRAERSDSGDGRVYLIVVRATDACGAAFTANTVVVPRSQSSANVASVNAQAASARAFCLANGGAPPPGYFVVGDGPIIGPKQ